MRLKGKIALITGATGGIGSAIAKRYLQEGARIVVADIDPDVMKKMCDDINAEFPDSAFPVYMDVSSEKSVNEGFDLAMNHFKKIDILISNAGIQHLAYITDFKDEDWQRVLAICLNGCFYTAKRAMKEMQQSGGGSIIFTGSLRSKIGGTQNSAYVASKHGVLGLNRVVATEGARYNIRSNVICPDYVLTPMVEKQIPQLMAEHNMSRDDVIKKVMLPETVDGKFTTLEDIAEVAVFFAAFPSSALTGQSLLLTHGWMME